MAAQTVAKLPDGDAWLYEVKWDGYRALLRKDGSRVQIRSRNALLRVGARFEGVLRAHRLSSDVKPRDSARYSILASEWPQVREHLQDKLAAR